jgi:hypothetical protein
MVFISLPAINEHLSATPSVGVHHIVCAILGDQQDVKHGISREADVKWIESSMARTVLHIQSMVARSLMRLKETKDRGIAVV